MGSPFDSFEIGDAQSGSWLANRPLWIGVAIVASVCAVYFYSDSVKFWSSSIVGAFAWLLGLGGQARIIVDSAKREIRFSEKTPWSEKQRRVISFDQIEGSEIGYRPAGDGDTYLPRLILKSGEKVALTSTGCEDRWSAEDMVKRVLEAVGKPVSTV